MECESQLPRLQPNVRGLQDEGFALNLSFKGLSPGFLGAWGETAHHGGVCGRENSPPHIWDTRENRRSPGPKVLFKDSSVSEPPLHPSSYVSPPPRSKIWDWTGIGGL